MHQNTIWIILLASSITFWVLVAAIAIPSYEYGKYPEQERLMEGQAYNCTNCSWSGELNEMVHNDSKAGYFLLRHGAVECSCPECGHYIGWC